MGISNDINIGVSDINERQICLGLRVVMLCNGLISTWD